MYLPRLNASRVPHRVKTAACTRSACVRPSFRMWHTVTDGASGGTSVSIACRGIVRSERVSTGPLIGVCVLYALRSRRAAPRPAPRRPGTEAHTVMVSDLCFTCSPFSILSF